MVHLAKSKQTLEKGAPTLPKMRRAKSSLLVLVHSGRRATNKTDDMVRMQHGVARPIMVQLDG